MAAVVSLLARRARHAQDSHRLERLIEQPRPRQLDQCVERLGIAEKPRLRNNHCLYQGLQLGRHAVHHQPERFEIGPRFVQAIGTCRAPRRKPVRYGPFDRILADRHRVQTHGPL